MAGSTSEGALRALVARGDSASTLDAVDLALTMSVTQVRGQLDYDFLAANAEEATRFIMCWLPRLDAFERMAAADWVGTQYVLSMVHIDHSYFVGARIIVEALAEVTRETADVLGNFRLFTEGPDAEVADSVADRFDRLADTLRTVHDEINAVVKSLTQDVPGAAALNS